MASGQVIDDDDDDGTRAMTCDQIESLLKQNGFLDPTAGIRERRHLRDPFLTILFDPEKMVTMEDEVTGQPYTISVIDSLLDAAHEQMKRAYGDIYNNFVLIQETMNVLLRSSDTPAKQFVLLCLIALDKGLQDEIHIMYPMDGGKEVNRLPEYIAQIKAQMEETLNTAYINVPRPSRYNVDTLLRNFLETIAVNSPG